MRIKEQTEKMMIIFRNINTDNHATFQGLRNFFPFVVEGELLKDDSDEDLV